MSILPHLRSKGPPSTPAQRLIELTGEVTRLRQERDLAFAERDILARRLARYEQLGGVSFGGIPAAQIWADFVLWESILNETQFRAIFELGTWQGGFSWWLWAQCEARMMYFYTFDAVDHQKPPYVPRFERLDIFADPSYLGLRMQAKEPLVLFCDNGNKPRELATFGPMLKHPDSRIIVHDWGTEMQPEAVPDTVEMVYEDFCKDLGSISRVFKVRTGNA